MESRPDLQDQQLQDPVKKCYRLSEDSGVRAARPLCGPFYRFFAGGKLVSCRQKTATARLSHVGENRAAT
jgi:hypothetical protein